MSVTRSAYSQEALSCILQQCCAPAWVSAKEFRNPPLDLDRTAPTPRLSGRARYQRGDCKPARSYGNRAPTCQEACSDFGLQVAKRSLVPRFLLAIPCGVKL